MCREQAKEFCNALLDNGRSIYEVEEMFPFLDEFEEEFPELKDISEESFQRVIWDTWEGRKLLIRCYVSDSDDSYNVNYVWNVVMNDPRHLGLCNNFIYKFMEFTKFKPEHMRVQNKHLVFAPENEWLNEVSMMFTEEGGSDFEFGFKSDSMAYTGRLVGKLDDYLRNSAVVSDVRKEWK